MHVDYIYRVGYETESGLELFSNRNIIPQTDFRSLSRKWPNIPTGDFFHLSSRFTIIPSKPKARLGQLPVQRLDSANLSSLFCGRGVYEWTNGHQRRSPGPLNDNICQTTIWRLERQKYIFEITQNG